MRQNSPHVRLCERCWNSVPQGSVCRIFRHADPAAPGEAPSFSYRHLDSDPACSGAQQPELWSPGRAA